MQVASRLGFGSAILFFLASLGPVVAQGSWEFLGPGGDPLQVFEVAVLATNPETLLVQAGAGTFRSVDAGGTWTRLDTRGCIPRSLRFVHDPVAPETVYWGWCRSTDGGLNWTELPTEPNPQFPGQRADVLAFSSQNPTLLYAYGTFKSSLQGGLAPAGLARSTDGGQQWETLQVPVLSDSPWFGPRVLIHPMNPMMVFVLGSAEQGGAVLLRTLDGGAHWDQPALPTGGGEDLVADPAQPLTLYLANSTGIWKSTDAGETWEAKNGDLPVASGNFLRLINDPADPLHLVALNWEPGIGQSPYRIAETQDGAETWEILSDGSLPPYLRSLTSHPLDFSRFWAGSDFGLQESLDGGDSWGPALGPRKPVNLLDLALASSQPETFLAAGELAQAGIAQALYRTIDGGENWETLDNLPLDKQFSPFPGGNFIESIAVDPEHTDRIYVGGSNGVLRSSDGGQTWDPLLPPDQSPVGSLTPSIYSIVIDPADPNRVFAGGDFCRIYRSLDGGDNWDFALDLLESCLASQLIVTFNRISVDPLEPNKLFAQVVPGPAAYRSGDGGNNWTAVDPTLPGQADYVVSGNREAGVMLYSVILNGPGLGLFRSSDQGESWEEAIAALPRQFSTSLIGDPEDPNRVFLYGQDGVLFSADRGEHWFPLDDGLPPGPRACGECSPSIPVNALVRGPDRLIAATPSGLYRFSGPLEPPGELPEPIAFVFPQFIDGGDPLGSPKPNSSRIILRNTDLFSAEVKVRFRDNTGEPAGLVVRGEGEVSEVIRMIPARGFTEIETEGEGDLKFGTVEVLPIRGEASKLQGTLVFSLLGTFVSVDGSRLRSAQDLFVSYIPDPVFGEDTGIAAYNPHPSRTVTVKLTLRDGGGTIIGQREGIAIAPRSQLLGFVTRPEFFEAELAGRPDPFEGTISIEAAEELLIGVTGLIQKRPQFSSALLAIASSPADPGGGHILFPQFFNGGESGSLQPNSSRIVILNGDDVFTQRPVLLIKSPQGNPLSIPFKGEEVPLSNLDRQVPPRGVVQLETDGSGPLVQGGVVMTPFCDQCAGVPEVRATGTLVFSLFGNFVSVPGIYSNQERPPIFVSLDPDPVLGENTGIAIFLGDEVIPQPVRLILYDSSGTKIGEVEKVLERFSQLVGFVNEENFFGSVLGDLREPFRGSLEIQAPLVSGGGGFGVLSLIQKTSAFNFALVAVP